jgi:hypothetical protein
MKMLLHHLQNKVLTGEGVKTTHKNKRSDSEKSQKGIFFDVVLLGTCHIYGTSEVSKSDEFKSLRERSPFAHTLKGEPKPQPQKSAPKHLLLPLHLFPKNRR